ncbi:MULTISPECIES: hypothetical protein [unclassified Sphingomonas]|uniref:hypothetical protein n=1 Tax=unclassified Sphingomonas TaxID=196159 RepID=UPI0021518D45|nr:MULTISPECIES: hypothetical protein [unclassified Sphingomonas]MCR5870687.1 hypothetical protein [Sphingomonas sp. J344]UUY00977.1 hypothetical protein LRS08_07955 [Sphingomonas sp. J315]
MSYDNQTYDNRPVGTDRVGNWMQTYTGKAFWPLDPRPEEVDIEDIAHSLSMQGRFAGHADHWYSIAEHSVYVSRFVPPEHALQALLHDASEAYVVDVPRPVKPALTNYREIEDRVWGAIARRFQLPIELHPSIKLADNAVLLAEQRDLLKPPPMPGLVPGEPAPGLRIAAVAQPKAKKWFLDRFHELTEERHLAA